jgi:hypothetical protein
MLNWTLPLDAFNHCINFSKTNKILTSSNFYDKVKNDFLEENKDKFVFLEDLLKDIPKLKKIKALINSFFMNVPKQSETAVILFTS